MKVTELFEAPILGRGMSKAARAADVEQSDREYIAQKQQRAKFKPGAMVHVKGSKNKGKILRTAGRYEVIVGFGDTPSTKSEHRAHMRDLELAESSNVLDLQMMVDMLNKERTIDEADLLKDGIEVQTTKGDLVRFHLNGGKLFAWVQGQKGDIDCGDIGDSVADIKAFLKGINKAWYREYDPHFDD